MLLEIPLVGLARSVRRRRTWRGPRGARRGRRVGAGRPVPRAGSPPARPDRRDRGQPARARVHRVDRAGAPAAAASADRARGRRRGGRGAAPRDRARDRARRAGRPSGRCASTSSTCTTCWARYGGRRSFERRPLFALLFAPARLREAPSAHAWVEAMLEAEAALAAGEADAGLISAAAADAIAAACRPGVVVVDGWATRRSTPATRSRRSCRSARRGGRRACRRRPPRRDQPGRARHGGDAGRAPRPRARRRGARGVAGPAPSLARSTVDADDRAHAAATGAADHVRAQGGRLARRRARRAGRPAADAARRAARRRGRHARASRRGATRGGRRCGALTVAKDSRSGPSGDGRRGTPRAAASRSWRGARRRGRRDGKVAPDVVLLAQAEVGEVAAGAGGPSTLPQKQNLVEATRARAAALRVPPLAALLLGAMAQEHERAAGAWHAEWSRSRRRSA